MHQWVMTPLLWLVLIVLWVSGTEAQVRPEGTMTWGVHVTLAPTWFDPAETPGIITPFMFLYALHDALVKPMPENPLTPSLAESWSESAEGLTYEFVLRPGVAFRARSSEAGAVTLPDPMPDVRQGHVRTPV